MSSWSVAVNVEAPPRGGGSQVTTQFYAQSMRGSFSWGSSPASAVLTYVGGSPVTTGSLLTMQIAGHVFSGICKSDTDVSGSDGQLRTCEFVDLRYFLGFDNVFCAFNIPDVRMVGGRRLKRYKHMFPADWCVGLWTFTDAPLLGWEILDLVLRAPTVFTGWHCDLTSNGLFQDGLLNWPVYELDATGGMRLDAFLNLICEKTGLLFCHGPVAGGWFVDRPNCRAVGPGTSGLYQLIWTRKGYGLPLSFPSNSDARRVGTQLTENPVNVCILGDRNRYQLLDVPMEPDWAAGWEQFLVVDDLANDLFTYECNAAGVRYNAYPDDTDGWLGWNEAKARALEITVGEYVALRNARAPGGGAAFMDLRKFNGRWRMDMPAALYTERLLFRAFRPVITGFTNADGNWVPMEAAVLSDQMLARVSYDAASGVTSLVWPLEPVDGNGVLLAKGYAMGEDLFRLVQPDRINKAFFQPASRAWSQVGFQIDDSGEGVRFVITDAPVFVSDDLLVDGTDDAALGDSTVINAGFTLAAPQVHATLVYEAERYVYWRGTGFQRRGGYDPGRPMPGRTRVEAVSGLNMEHVLDAYGGTVEVPYANYQTADERAYIAAESLLLNQQVYTLGGYNLKWDPDLPIGQFGTMLAPSNSSCIDRIEIQTGPDGTLEVVDFTAERQRDHFEPERELDRRSLQNSLFAGQQELRVQAQDWRRFNAALRGLGRNDFSMLRHLLTGEADVNLSWVRFLPGATVPVALPAGTVIRRAPANRVVTAPASVAHGTDTVFAGVVVRHNEKTIGAFPVKSAGDALARVKGPVAVNASVGLSSEGGTDFATNGAYLAAGGTPAVGVALKAIAGSTVELIPVRLGSAASAGGDATRQAFKVVGVKRDYLECHEIAADGTEGGTVVNVARPVRHRCPDSETVYGLSKDYDYDYNVTPPEVESWVERRAHWKIGGVDVYENEIIHPEFGSGTGIWATQVNRSGVSVSGADLTWMMTNDEGYAWSKKWDVT